MRLSVKNIEARKSKSGRGIFALRSFRPREYIFEMKGKLLTASDIEAEGVFSALSAHSYRFSEELYLSPIGENGDSLRHSCMPNAYVYKSHDKLFIRAISPIAKNKEVRIDYSTIMADDDNWSMRCKCGTKKCRQVIKRFSLLPKKLQKKYEEMNIVPNYIYSVSEICAVSVKSQNLGLRRQSILALQQQGFDKAAPTLLEILRHDKSSVIRHDAAFVFGQIQDKRAIPYLVRAVQKDISDLVRHEAIEALGDIGMRTRSVEGILWQCLKDKSPIIKDTAEMALVTLGELEQSAA